MRVVSLLALAGALLALSSVSHARLMYFRADRCNTNLENPGNWKGRLPLFAETDTDKAVRVTHIGPTEEEEDDWKPVSTYSRPVIIRTGSVTLGKDGVLSMDGDGFRLELFDEAETEGEAEFIGGQEFTKECDINCGDNWDMAPPGTPANQMPEDDGLPVCEDDIGVIPDGYSVKLYVPNFANVYALRWGADGEDVMDAYHIPPHQVYPPPHYLLMDFNKKEDICGQKDLYGQDLKCICASTCAADIHLEQAQVIRGIAYAVSKSDMDALVDREKHVFDGSFNYRALLADFLGIVDIDDSFECLLDDYVFDATSNETDPIVEGILTHMKENLPQLNMTIHSLQYSRILKRISISGEVEGPYTFFHKMVDETTFKYTWANTFAISKNLDIDRPFHFYLWDSFLKPALQCRRDHLNSIIPTKKDECDAIVNDFCSDMQPLIDSLSPWTAEDDLELLIDTMDSISSVRRRRDTEINTRGVTIDLADMTFKDSVDEAELQELVSRVTDLLGKVPAGSALRSALLDAVRDFVDEQVELIMFEASVPTVPRPIPERITYPGAYIGDRLAQADLNHIAGPHNEHFGDYLAEELSKVWPVVRVHPETVSWQLREPDNRRLRRGSFTSTGLAQILLYVTFDFDMLVADDCVPGDPRITCPLSSNTTVLYDFMRLTLDDIVSTYEIITPSCFNMDTGVNISCVEMHVWDEVIACGQASISNLNRNNLINTCGVPAFTEAYGCGEFGQQASGACFDPSVESDAASMAVTSVPPIVDAAIAFLLQTTTPGSTTTQPTTAEALSTSEPKLGGSSGGADSETIILAAIAAAVVVILIVIIVVAVRIGRKRDAKTAPDSEKERNMSAFDNPMYEDAARETDGGYLDANADGEPVYNEVVGAKQDKENPLYSSAEDLLATGEEDGGYLATAPDDGAVPGAFPEPDDEEEEEGGGYLDVAPEPDQQGDNVSDDYE